MTRLDAQRAWFAAGHTRPVMARVEALKRLRQVFLRREEDVYGALAADLGKPRFEALLSEVSGILAELGLAIRQTPRWARERRRPNPWLLFPGRSFVRPQPYGTVLVLSPWNFPFELALSPLIGAIAAGNTVVLKPSEHAPASAQLLEEIVAEAFPPEHARVVNGGVEVAEALLKEPFDSFFFTGGEAVGRRVMQAAAERLVPVTLELGGKSPVVVTARARLELAARRVLFGRAFNAGQVCIGPDYALVERRVHPAFLEALRAEHARMFPEFPGRDLARIVNPRHYERIVRYLADGRVVCGGRTHAETRQIEPTVLTDVDPSAGIMREEVFGPILPVLAVDDLEAALRFIEARPRPLAAYLFSEDQAEHRVFLERTISGGVTINDVLSHFVNRSLPFGGVGSSGLGAYHGEASFRAFSHLRAVQVAGTVPDVPLKYPPYSERTFGVLRRLVAWWS